MNSINTQSGLSIVATILALLIFSLFIAVAVSLVTTGAHIGVQETQGQQAFYIAEGGAEWGLRKLNEGIKCDDGDPNSLDDISTPPVSLGTGTDNFSLSGTEYKPAPKAQLLNNINDSQNSIQADRPLTAYAPSGMITIESETIDYTSISGDTFIGCLRGVDGTSASAHTAIPTKLIFQNQCDIISTGTISSNPLASIKRVVRVSATP